jgi:hypothetical protein
MKMEVLNIAILGDVNTFALNAMVLVRLGVGCGLLR